MECQIEDNWGGGGGAKQQNLKSQLFTDKIIKYPESDSSLP